MKFSRSLTASFIALMILGPASAHTSIVSANIEDGVVMDKAPTTFDFSFGAEVGLAGLEIGKLSGDVVVVDFERSRQMKKEYSIALPTLDDGSYVIKWRAVSGDGHVMKGEVSFALTT